MTLDEKKILLAGGPTGCWTNAGDEAVFLSMAASLRTEIPNAELTVVSSSPPGWFTERGFGEIRYDDIPRLVAAARESDLLILGGGSIFYDYWGFDPSAVLTPQHSALSFYGGFAVLAAALRKPLMIHSVGAGPLQSDAAREFTRDVFNSADAITVRDEESVHFLERLGIPSAGIELTADPALLFESKATPRTSGLLAEARANGRHTLAVTIREWKTDARSSAEAEAAVAEALDRFAASRDAAIVFVPLHRAADWPLTDDRGAAERVRSAMLQAERCIIAEETLAASEKAEIVRAADLVLAMRLHGAIFAVGADVPTVGISYDPKVAAFLERAGLAASTLPFDQFTAQSLDHALQNTFDDRASIRSRIAVRRETFTASIRRSAQIARELLQREKSPAPPAVSWLFHGRSPAPFEAPAIAALAGRIESARTSEPARTHPSGARGSAGKRVGILTNRLLDWHTFEPRHGGAERYCVDLAALMVNQGLDVTLFQSAIDQPFESEYYGHKVIGIPMAGQYAEFQYGVGDAFFEMTRDFDHVLYMMPNYASGEMREDAVVICHGIWFDHDLLPPPFKYRSAEWFGHLYRVFSRARQVVSVDTNSANVIRSFWPELGNRFTYLPNGVDTSLFHPPAERLPGPLTVLIPRRADVIRGTRLMSEILAHVQGHCRFVWAGDGDGEEPEILRRLSERDPRFHLTSATFQQMPDLYRNADVCLIPTVASEGTSLSCLEGLASGSAVVATNVGGLPDIIQPEVNGLLVDPDPRSIARAVGMLLSDVELRVRLQVAGRASARNFTLEKWRSRWQTVLGNLGWISPGIARTEVEIS